METDPRGAPAAAADEGRRRLLLECAVWGCAGGAAAVTGIPIVGALLSPLLRRREPQWTALGPVADLPVGAPVARVIALAARDGYAGGTHSVQVWVARGPAGPFALSGECTHLGCNVNWDLASRRFLCPCHGGQYDAAGAVLAGPPPRPLDGYPTEVRDGVLWVQL